ncbi:MAG: cysteine--tRNA ligase [Pseudomonadota bacterium]
MARPKIPIEEFVLKLTNSATRRKETFVPIEHDHVRVYVCGPTVYNHPHIGNARPPVVFDVLVRYLRAVYQTVTYARNITDVDDRIAAAAKARNVGIEVIANEYEAVYLADMEALGVAPPDIAPHATDYIAAIVRMIEDIIREGAAYLAEGHVLFDVTAEASYGSLSGRSREDMIAGARVEVAPYKRDPADFVLWKPSRDDQPGWSSPWGRGRPGWHIECSAMIRETLGTTIDIHGGGADLLFPHHENEAAQSCAAHAGAPLAKYWVHNGFVNMGRDKMSKSIGNVVLVSDLLKDHPGEVLRLALLSAHYRQPLEWGEELLTRSRRLLDRYYGLLRGKVTRETGVPAPMFAALSDDINTPKALSVLAELARDISASDDSEGQAEARGRLKAAGSMLGLLQTDPEAWFQGSHAGSDALDTQKIEAKLKARTEARARRDFAAADAVRDELDAMGVLIEDTPDGPIWRKKS